MGSEGSHITLNDTPLAPSAKQRKKEGKRVVLQAKVDELEAQNNKIAMKNEVLHEQYEKLFETLHETMRTQTHELVALMDINDHLGAPNTEGHLPSTWVSLMRSELIIKTVINMRLLSTQLLRPEAGEINDPRVSKRLGPLLRPRPAANLGKEQHVLEEHEGTWDSEVFRQTRHRSQYGESKEKSHALAQTFLLPKGDGDLRKKIPVVHDSIQNPLVLQLIEEVNKLKAEHQAEHQAEIPDWNQSRLGPLIKRIIDTPFKRR
ncbi:hypothetical protein FF2_045593 [Malus domestica]